MSIPHGEGTGDRRYGAMAESAFYSSGLRFQCTRCSRCCRYTPGYVFLSQKDLEALVAALGISRRAFLDAYCRKVAFGPVKRISLKEKPNLDCIFWENQESALEARRNESALEARRNESALEARRNESALEARRNESALEARRGGCAVYDSRPLQCRSFPFWSSFLSSQEEWRECAAQCPGIGKGPLHPKRVIDRWLALRREEGFIE